MKKEKLQLHENAMRMAELAGVNPAEGKSFIVVDVQPEYSNAFRAYMLPELIDFLNQNYDSLSRLVFLYNGADTLGLVSEGEYKMWWIENGLDEVVIDYAVFYDKGYAFFRYCMDEGIDETQTANLVRYMI